MTKTIQTVSTVTLVALFTFAFAIVSPASAFWFNGDDITVDNTNEANITNNLEVEAETGDNESEGGDGEEGGDGGDATADDGEAYGGDGGNGGTGGAGNAILTGSALAIGTVNNDINRNVTRINRCGCDEEEDDAPAVLLNSLFGGSGDIAVTNRNRTILSNTLEVEAETGDNESEGGDGEEGGDGGSATAEDNNFFWWLLMDNNNVAAGGAGGNGGNGATGGTIATGASQSDGLITNVINRNITRILR